jgi:hypothetical protein
MHPFPARLVVTFIAAAGVLCTYPAIASAAIEPTRDATTVAQAITDGVSETGAAFPDIPPTEECENGDDDDIDEFADFPADTQCASPNDDDEATAGGQGFAFGPQACNDGIDNEGDGRRDFGGELFDPDCASANDDDEETPGEQAGTGGNNPAAGSDVGLTSFPAAGASYAILSSGNTGFADDPDDEDDASASNGGSFYPERGLGDVNDLVSLRINVDVPASANCLRIDFRFLSEEFPNFVGSSVNDAFVAELDSSNFTAAPPPAAEIDAPNNFAFAPRADNPAVDDVVSVNSAGMSEANAAGSTYDGATPRLRASTPITPGEHSVFLTVFDQGDSILDSAVFLDNLVLAAVPPASCTAGASADFTPPDTTITAGPTDGETTTNASPTFGLASSEAGSGFECAVDGGALEDCGPEATIGPLAPGSHTFTGRATDAAGNADPSPATRTFTVAAPEEPPPGAPVVGESVNVATVDGTVRIKCKGDQGFSELEGADQIPVGCLIDTRRGTVRLTSSTGTGGGTQSGEFWDGLFRVKQKVGKKPDTELVLEGSLNCGKKDRALSRKGRGGRGLWGDGKGKFTSRGHRGAGSSRGTKWFVGDRCNGSTFVKVKRGVVRFRDFVDDRTVIVRAGESYATDPRKG